MPSTIERVFAAANLEPAGAVRWGDPVPHAGPGVYVVALTSDTESLAAALPDAPISDKAVDEFLSVRPALRIDGKPATPSSLAQRLRQFWLDDEVVLYIGLASSLRSRVRAYYKTPLGAQRPYAGGWWLRTLSSLDGLVVHFAPTAVFEMAEKQMLRAATEGISLTARSRLRDQQRVMPFANLRGWGSPNQGPRDHRANRRPAGTDGRDCHFIGPGDLGTDQGATRLVSPRSG